MKSCFKSTLVSVGAFLSITLAAISCTSVNDYLGANLIPGDQQMKIQIDTFGIADSEAINLYITSLHNDSIPGTNSGVGLMGNYISEFTGTKSRTAFLGEISPGSPRVDTTGNKFGHKVTIDSVKLGLSLTYVAGKKGVEQTFNVYELADSIRRDSSYYINAPYERIGDMSEPLFSFKHTVEEQMDTSPAIMVDLTTKGTDYLYSLFSDTTLYNTDEIDKFKDKFKGLLVVADPSSTEDGTIISTQISSTGLLVYFHNYESPTSDRIKDTTVVNSFLFRTTLDKSINNHITTIRNDYSAAPFASVESAEDNEIGPVDVGYVEGLASVRTIMELPDGLFESLEALKEDGKYDLKINQALLFISLVDDNTEKLDESFSRLGLYNTYYNWTTVPDYSPYDEARLSSNLRYGGYLNRTFGYYTLDLTTYFTRALVDSEISRRVELAPPAGYILYNGSVFTDITSFYQASTTAIAGAGDKKPKLRLTYTLIQR